MKAHFKILLIGLGIILLTNAVALWGVSNNRAVTVSTIELTERELPLPYRYISKDENSGLHLRLNWRSSYENSYMGDGRNAKWFDRDKLNELGFGLPKVIDNEEQVRPFRKMLPKDVYLVLEYDGEMFQRSLEYRKNELSEAQALLVDVPDSDEFKRRVDTAQVNLDKEMSAASRLFVVDAGLDEGLLRQRYPDESHYLIMRGLVDLQMGPRYSKGTYEPRGWIKSILVSEINVPIKYRPVFEPMETYNRGRPDNNAPRYSIELAIGSRLEPWIVGVKALTQLQ